MVYWSNFKKKWLSHDIEEEVLKETKNSFFNKESFQPEILIQTHIKRVFSQNSNNQGFQWAYHFCEKWINEEIKMICLIADEKMNLALKDGKRHSSAIFNKQVCINISAFPNPILEVKRNYYNNGYLDYLNNALKNARKENPGCHYMHFQFFWTGSNYLFQFTLFPNRNILPFDPFYIIPIDILTENERTIISKNVSNSVPQKMEFISKTQLEIYLREKEDHPFNYERKKELDKLIEKNREKWEKEESEKIRIEIEKKRREQENPSLDYEKQKELDKLSEKNRKDWEKKESEKIRIEIKETLERESNKKPNKRKNKRKKIP